MSFDPYRFPGTGDDFNAVKAKTTPPAVALIVVAVVNLLASFVLMFFGFSTTQMTPAQLEQEMARRNPQQLDQMKQVGWTVEDVLRFYLYGGLGGGAVALFIALLTVLGAARMLVLKSYGLSIFVSVLTAVPCISPSACCLLGEGIGIWALVVLLQPNVKAAFARGPGRGPDYGEYRDPPPPYPGPERFNQPGPPYPPSSGGPPPYDRPNG